MIIKGKIRVLIAEDLPTDAELAQREIRLVLPNCEFIVVEEEVSFKKALDDFKPDLVVSDYMMPTFDGMLALKLTRKKYEYMPFVILTGSMNEDTAVECIKAGADDYVIKEHIKRLGSAVVNAIEKKQIELEKSLAIRDLKQSEELNRAIMQTAADAIVSFSSEGLIFSWNLAAEKIFNYSKSEIINTDFSVLISKDSQQEYQEIINELETADNIKLIGNIFEIIGINRAGDEFPIEFSLSYWEAGNQRKYTAIIRDITLRKKAELELKKLSQAIEQSPLSVMITNPIGEIEYVNHRFYEVTGYSRKKVIGKNPRFLSSGKLPEKFYKQLWDTILSGKTWVGEFLNKKENGDLYWENAIISQVRDGLGNVSSYIAVKEDITEKKKLWDELILAKEKAEESDRLKSAFLANISHEIRTPMNGILGFAELIKMNVLGEEKTKEYIDIIEDSGNRMLNIINDLIDISKIESNLIILDLKGENINSILEEICNFFKPLAQTKNINIDWVKNENLDDVNVLMDSGRIKQVLSNLFDNAIKFSENGEILFGVKNKKSVLEFFIKDNGIGIPKDKQSKIFDRFFQVDDSLTRSYDGSGVGLSISKAIVELHGGKIWVESVPDKGSTFYFTIPSKPPETNKSQTNSNEMHNTLEDLPLGLKILIADDEYQSFTLLQEFLKDSGVETIWAKNGREAIDLAFVNPDLDLILMDIMMPELDGVEATKIIKERLPDVPVIAQTALALVNDEKKIREGGCDDYISKPINLKKLLEMINKYTKNKD